MRKLLSNFIRSPSDAYQKSEKIGWITKHHDGYKNESNFIRSPSDAYQKSEKIGWITKHHDGYKNESTDFFLCVKGNLILVY